MALYAERPEWAGRPLRTIFFGGGTPTVLPAQDLAVLAAAVRRRFAVTPDAEWSIEANPEGLDGDLLAALAAAGWNRLSLGLQDWDDDRLRALGRRHTVADFLAAFRAARRAGFANINVDLVYGLPGQTPAAWRATLIRVVELGPEHISAYALQVEEGTAFARWAREGRLDRPDEDTCAEMYAIACEELARHGYRRYEVSNFARPGHRCRHNLTYWRNGDYLGIGPGAHSHLALPAPGGPSGLRWANLRTVGAYRQAVTAGSLPRAEEETCPPEREMSDTVILGLRLDEGVDLDAFQARFGRPVEAVFQPAVDRLEHMGLLRREPGRLRLTDRAWPVANRVFAAFLDVAPTAAAF
ncbi:MAG: radical SAM family heme chaperone HemW [Clostridia bacterium]|nr:radical SAM family heme chaperone HemW [Clostridia bacterium]